MVAGPDQPVQVLYNHHINATVRILVGDVNSRRGRKTRSCQRRYAWIHSRGTGLTPNS